MQSYFSSRSLHSGCSNKVPTADLAAISRKSAISAFFAAGWLIAAEKLGLGQGAIPAAAAAAADGRGDSNGGLEFREGKGGDTSGSVAALKESYDGFADSYDDLDGGWAASAMGMEVCG